MKNRREGNDETTSSILIKLKKKWAGAGVEGKWAGGMKPFIVPVNECKNGVFKSCFSLYNQFWRSRNHILHWNPDLGVEQRVKTFNGDDGWAWRRQSLVFGQLRDAPCAVSVVNKLARYRIFLWSATFKSIRKCRLHPERLKRKDEKLTTAWSGISWRSRKETGW